MVKEILVFIHTMEYYSAIKRNGIGSFVEMWMDLETAIQSEVSQKEKNKYRILTHICGIWKHGIDELICKAEIETKTERTNVWITRGGKGEVVWIGRLGLTYIHYYV